MRRRKLVFDLEFLDDRILCNGWKWSGEGNPITVDDDITEEFAGWLADPNIIKVCHSKTDWRTALLDHGFKVAGPLHDTMVMAWVINENTPLSLEWCAKRYCGITMDKRIRSVAKEPYFRRDDGVEVHLRDAPLDQLKKYNYEDVDSSDKLYLTLLEKMAATAWDIYFEEEQVPFTSLLLKMETAGIPIDLEEAANLKAELEPRLEDEAKGLAEVLGYELRKPTGEWNWGSNDMLREVLFKKVWYQKDEVPIAPEVQAKMRKPWMVAKRAELLGIPKSHVQDADVQEMKAYMVQELTPAGFTVTSVGRTKLKGHWTRAGYGLRLTPLSEKTQAPSVSSPDLLTEHGDHPFVTQLIKWRKIKKVISTYLEAYPRYTRNGRLYGQFNQTGTKTGRISSARPNLMNQPAHGELGERIRKLFRGRFIIGDYGQLEPRLMAHFSQDTKLLEVYNEGIDVYAVTASGLFGGTYRDYDEKHPKRKLSKTVFLGTQYGAGYKKLKQILALNGFVVSLDESKRFIADLEATYPELYAWKDAVIREAHLRGYVETLDGHRRRLAVALRDRSWKNRGYGERQAVNARVQGSAGDVVRRCMVAADEAFPQLTTLFQVHDEVGWEPDPGITQSQAESLLPIIRTVMQEAHDFDLSVPLVFEPTICRTWADKGMHDVDWDEFIPTDLTEVE